MPDSTDSIKTVTLQFIADTPRLRTEKPYRIRGFDIDPADKIDLTNLEWESHSVKITDLRQSANIPNFNDCSFTWIDYKANTTPSYSEISIIAYCEEMIALLHDHIDAEHIVCYDMRVCTSTRYTSSRTNAVIKLRKNMGQDLTTDGPRVDRELPDAPIEAAHIGRSLSYNQGSMLTISVDHSKLIGWARIAHHLTPAERDKYFGGEYRLRIFK